MTFSELLNTIQTDETKTLELKKTTGELKEGMRTACAFLNTYGGWLLFGITPVSLRILGENVTDNTRREIAQALRGIEPRTNIDVEYIDVPDRPNCQVIAMHFDGWHDGLEPYTYDGCPYWRIESTTERMPRAVYDKRLRICRNYQYAWEQQPAVGLTLADLDENRIRQIVRIGVDNGRMPATAMGVSSEEILTKLNLMHNKILTNAAVVLFAKEETAFPQLLLRMAQFRGADKNEFADNKRKQGNFFDMLDAGMAFLCDKLPIHGRIEGLRREEQYEIPLKALREALVNALCHREYAVYSDSVSIAVYDDRVEINNPGKLPYGLTAENIKLQHESHPHNPLIAEVLFRTGYLENWGSGVQRMVSACRAAGIPEPSYKTTNDAITVIFHRPYHADMDKLNRTNDYQATQTYNANEFPEEPQTIDSEDDTLHTLSHSLSQSLSHSLSQSLSWEKVARLFLMLDTPKRLKEVREALGLSDATYFKKNYIDPLIATGYLALTIPDKPTSSQQRYCLTEKGYLLLNKLIQDCALTKNRKVVE